LNVDVLQSQIAAVEADLLVVGLYEGEALPDDLADAPGAADAKDGFEKLGLLHPERPCRVMVAGLGKRDEMDAERARVAAALVAKEAGSLDAPALDAGGQRLIDKINHLVEDLAPYSDERDQLATALFGTSEILTIDQDGRTIVPERLREHAGITTHITFVGLGEKFQMWEPERFERHLADARQKVRDLRKLLGAGRRGSGGPEGARE